MSPHPVTIIGTSVVTAAGPGNPGWPWTTSPSRINLDQLPESPSFPYFLLARESSVPATSPANPFAALMERTVDEAVRSAGLSHSEIADCALFLGSTSLDIGWYEKRLKEGAATWDTMQREVQGRNRFAEACCERYGIQGGAYTITTACTSGANAILQAVWMLRAGAIERAVVAGVEFYNDLTLYGFRAMDLLEPDQYRPFDRRRRGIVLGEGAAAVVLESRQDAAEGPRILGGATACDPHNIATHAPDGSVVRTTMERACEDGGIPVQALGAIKCHGTGTIHNDACEGAAVRSLFGEHYPPIFSLKPYCGHTMGACGVVELVLCAQSFAHGTIPATPGFSEPDPEVGIAPTSSHHPYEGAPVVLNYFGFGGNCASMVMQGGGR